MLTVEVDCTETDATKFWLTLCHMGVGNYRNLATIATRLLSIPTSNWD